MWVRRFFKNDEVIFQAKPTFNKLGFSLKHTGH